MTRTEEARELAREALPVLMGSETPAVFEKRLRHYEASRQVTVVLVDRRNGPAAALRPGLHRPTAELRVPLAKALRGRGTSTHLGSPLRPKEVIVAEPVRRGDEVVGALGFVASGAAARRKVEHHTLLLMGVAVLALVAVGLAAVPLSRWLLRPVRRFDDTARAIIDGAHDVRVRGGAGPREMDGLADSFNQMADHLVTSLKAQQAMVADASHQMRAPLTALRLRLELLESGVRPEARKQLDQAVAETERICAMLDQLLGLARTEGRRHSVAPVDVAQVVASRVAAWEQTATRGGIRLRALGAGGTVAAGTPGHLEQILDVLIDNALQVSAPDTSVVLRHLVVGRHVHVYVTDQGPGMSAEECRLALGRFWRGGQSRNHAGSGLGLAIADALAKAGGGSLRLRPVLPHGIEALLRMPLHPPAARTGEPVPACSRATGP
ncbi:HAMP domain-containing sensor histidine kinase [Streptomyces sp. NPDC045251]|uniref:sensor histidine kinase n=1 Tax=unclassified Streptomyces TaxID=2593676 RepID=UPI0033CC4CC2